MSFDRNARTPHFSLEELRNIYENTKKPSTHTLQDTARRLYPDRDPVMYENIFLGTGPGRSFKHNGDEYIKPKWMLIAYPLMAGVMDDGTIYGF